MKNNLYPASDKELLLEAFRVLDTEKNGYLDLHTYYHFLRTFGVSFTKDQISEMEKFFLENETEFLEPTKLNQDNDPENARQKHSKYKSRRFYYESYVFKVTSDNKKHFDSLISDYEAFKKKTKDEKKEAAAENKV